MDGRRVLSKAGPSFFGWRRSRDDREIRVTRDGVEVSSGGKRIWGVSIGN